MRRSTRILLILALVGVGVLGRLVPHLPNATPLTALIALSTRYLGRQWSLVVPLLTLGISDLVIGLYDWRIMASVYVSFGLISIMSWILGKRLHTTLWLTIFGPIIFFLVTNGAVWAFSPWYEKSFTGLLYAYELGLPFLKSMMLGDLVYVSASILAVCTSRWWSQLGPSASQLRNLQTRGS